jgi:hypothetical protein
VTKCRILSADPTSICGDHRGPETSCAASRPPANQRQANTAGGTRPGYPHSPSRAWHAPLSCGGSLARIQQAHPAVGHPDRRTRGASQLEQETTLRKDRAIRIVRMRSSLRPDLLQVQPGIGVIGELADRRRDGPRTGGSSRAQAAWKFVSRTASPRPPMYRSHRQKS